MNDRRKRRRRLGFERRILLYAAGAVVPALTTVTVLVWTADLSGVTRWSIVFAVLLLTAFALYLLHANLVFPLRTLSNLIASIREEDYSFRARIADANDAMGEVMTEVNALITMLREQRLDALEATALVRAVIQEIDSAIFTFDGEHRLLFVNRAGERLLGRPAETLTGRTAADFGLEECLAGDDLVTLEKSFPGGSGRWGVGLSTFREKGLKHQLLVITDLSRALRQEERQAWQRLLRVLGHELNNSLAPIRSIASSLATILSRDPLPDDAREDLRSGVSVISSRSEALTRFMEAYSKLARLPQPTMKDIEIASLVRRVIRLEQRLEVKLDDGPEVVIHADPDQLEQALINLVRNAVDAASQTGGGVSAGWSARNGMVDIVIRDEGPGISGSKNLFVPFYTTKPGGTGIGLALSRQIVEAHGGTLTLENRADRTGCEARVRIPA